MAEKRTPTRDEYFPKFRTIRRSTGDELDPATTFTLLPLKDPYAKVALQAYSDACRAELPGLASMLEETFDLIEVTKARA
jgi:hypothetical protein